MEGNRFDPIQCQRGDSSIKKACVAFKTFLKNRGIQVRILVFKVLLKKVFAKHIQIFRAEGMLT